MPPIPELMWFAAALAGAGAVGGLLAGLFGVGGGAVFVLVFYQVFGVLGIDEAVRMHLSVGTSLAIIVPTSLRSFMAHHKRGAVDMDVLRSWALPVPAGVVAASLVVASVSSDALRAIFSILAALAGVRMLMDWQRLRLGLNLPANPWRAIVGVLVGLLSALMGVGGGILSNLFMTSYGRPVHQAVATSSGVGVLVSLPGLLGYVWAGWALPGLPPFSTGYVNWAAFVMVIPITLLVAPMGVRLAHALSKRQMEMAFGVFLLFIAARFVASLI